VDRRNSTLLHCSAARALRKPAAVGAWGVDRFLVSAGVGASGKAAVEVGLDKGFGFFGGGADDDADGFLRALVARMWAHATGDDAADAVLHEPLLQQAGVMRGRGEVFTAGDALGDRVRRDQGKDLGVAEVVAEFAVA